MKTKRKLLLLLSISVLFILIFAQSTRGSYTKDVTIDLEKDSAYECIYDSVLYDAYYSNSNKEHFIYMNFSYDISSSNIELSATGFNEDLSDLEVETSYLHSKHNDERLEFRVMREVVGDRMTVSIDSTDIIFVLSPESPSNQDPIPEVYIDEKEEDGEVEEEKPKFSLGDWIIGLINLYNTNPIMWILTSFLMASMIIRMWRVTEKPYTYVQSNKKYKKEYIGRFISEKISEDLPNYWEQKFKSNNGVRIFYNKMNYQTMKNYMFNSIALLHRYYPHIKHREVELFSSLQFPEKERVKTNWNFVKYVLYRLVCIFIPSGKIAESFHNWVSYKDAYEQEVIKKDVVHTRIRKRSKIVETKDFKRDSNGNLIPKMVTKIDVLQHEYLLKKIKTVCDLKYKKKVIDEEEGEIEKDKDKDRVPLYIVSDLKKDANVVKGSIEILKEYKIPVNVYDMEQAMKERHDIDEIMSIHDMEMQEKDIKYKKLSKKYHNSRNINRSLKNQRIEDIEKYLTEFQEQALYNEMDLPSLLGRAVALRNLTGDKAEAIKTAITEHLEKKQLEKKQKELLLEDRRDKEIKNLYAENQKLVNFIQSIREDLPHTIHIEEEPEDDITKL